MDNSYKSKSIKKTKKFAGFIRLLLVISIMGLGTFQASACQYKLRLSHVSGSSWSGMFGTPTVDLSVNSTTVISGWTKPSGPIDVDSTFTVSTGDQISVTYNANGAWFDSDYSYSIVDANGQVVYTSGAGGAPSSMTNPVTGTCPMPDNGAIASISKDFSTGNKNVYTTLQNPGNNNITSAQIEWSVDGNMQNTYSFSGTLTSNNSTKLTLGSYNFSAGYSTIKVWITGVNNGSDNYNANDTLEKIIYNRAKLTLPFYEDFEDIGSNTSFDGVNADPINGIENWSFNYGGTDGRVRFDLAGGYNYSGNHSATLDNGSTSDTNKLVLNLPIDALYSSDIRLSFKYMDHGDELHSGDKVWARGSRTDSWVEIYDLKPDSTIDGQWNAVAIDLDQALSSQTITSGLQIMFGQSDGSSTNTPGSGDGITFDNIGVTEVYDNDMQMLSWDAPSTGIELGNAMDVSLSLKNAGLNPQSNFTVKYSLDGGNTFHQETVNSTLQPGDTLNYTFTQKGDFSSAGSKDLIAVVKTNLDPAKYNDTIHKQINNFTIPYTENFDNVTAPKLPAGWSKMVLAIYGEVAIMSDATWGAKVQSPPNALNFENSNYDNANAPNHIAVFPKHMGNIANNRIQFGAYTEETTAFIVVGVMDSPTDTTSFTAVDTVNFSQKDQWVTKIADLTSYTGSGKYIALRYGCPDSNTDLWIDDLTLEIKPTSPIFKASPDSINMTGVINYEPDTSLKTITVRNNGVGTLSITNTTITGTNDTNFAVLDTNSYPKDLQSNENISMKVKFFGNSTGNRTANLDITANSTTHTIPLNGNVVDPTINTFPYTENFEHEGMLPLGWKTSSNDGDFLWQINQGTTGSSSTGPDGDHTSGNGYYIFTEASSPADQGDEAMLVTPPVDFSSISNPGVILHYHMYGSDIDTFALDVATNGTWNNNVKNIIGQQQTAESDPYKQLTVGLGSYSNADSIRFRVIRGGGYTGDVAMDDITFAEVVNVDLGPDTALCAGSSITFSAGTGQGMTYEWYQPGQTTPFAISESITVDSAGTYIAYAENNAGMSDRDTVQITAIHTLPSVSFSTSSGPTYSVCSSADNLSGTPAGGNFTGNGINGSNFDPSNAGAGSHVITYTYTDGNGCSNQDTMHLTVNPDNNSPVTVTQDITTYLDNSGQTSITVSDIDNGSTDDCGIQNSTLNINNFDCSDVGANKVMLTVTDVNGNFATDSATVTVADTIAPAVATQNTTLYLDYNGNATLNASQIDNGSTDNCGIQSISLNNNSFTCSDLGANTVQITVTDNNGNTAQGQAIVTVADTIKPTPITKNLNIYLDNNGQASLTASDVNNGSFDNCGINSLSLSKTNFDCTDTVPQTIHLIANDGNGNTDSAAATITVMDTIAPVISSVNDTTICAGIYDFNHPMVTDNCNASLHQISGPASGDSLSPGMYNVVYLARDSWNNTSYNQFTITVSDYPTVELGPDTTICHNESITLQVDDNYSNYQWSDGSTGSSLTIDSLGYGLGTHTFTLTVTNASGCQTIDSVQVTIENCTSTEELSQQENIRIYPNPNNGKFTLELNGNSDKASVRIYTLDGRLVQSKQIERNALNNNKFVIDISDQSAGIYLLQLRGANLNINRRIIKH